jgi:hypothetical protein
MIIIFAKFFFSVTQMMLHIIVIYNDSDDRQHYCDAQCPNSFMIIIFAKFFFMMLHIIVIHTQMIVNIIVTHNTPIAS